jgi:hypothetical protein
MAKAPAKPINDHIKNNSAFFIPRFYQAAEKNPAFSFPKTGSAIPDDIYSKPGQETAGRIQPKKHETH